MVKVALYLCDQNPWNLQVKKLIYSKIAYIQYATLLEKPLSQVFCYKKQRSCYWQFTNTIASKYYSHYLVPSVLIEIDWNT